MANKTTIKKNVCSLWQFVNVFRCMLVCTCSSDICKQAISFCVGSNEDCRSCVCVSVCMSVRPSVCLSVCMYVCLLSVRLSVCLSLCLSVCLLVYLCGRHYESPSNGTLEASLPQFASMDHLGII